MIVRTYGRRNRGGAPGTYSDSLDGDNDPSVFDSLSQETSQDFCSFNLLSQESSSIWSSSFDPDLYGHCSSQRSSSQFEDALSNDTVRKTKRAKNGKREAGKAMTSWVPSNSTTLMEAQEFGEMMEHVDEVNFALDGLKKEQPVRIRRASLLSLLSICGTVHQRRLLRTQGIAKNIVDAILGLSFDDSPCNLAAAALFHVLTSDGQDDHLLESPSSIRFLIKLLKPVISAATVDKARNMGFKLLALRKDIGISREVSTVSDSSAAAILSKVQQILVSSKDVKSWDDGEMERLELNAKWMALLTMEKACLSKISFEDVSGAVRKTGGNFKEKLRELGGLYTVFEVAMECHNVFKRMVEYSQPSTPDVKDYLDLQSLAILLKCLKIMENATFLSKDNQTHLLGMRGKLASHGSKLSFTSLIISIIKILSGFYLLQHPPATSGNEKCSLFDAVDNKVDSNEAKSIGSSKRCSSTGRTSSEISLISSQRSSRESYAHHSVSSSESATTSMRDSCLIKTGLSSSSSGSCHGAVLRISSSETLGTSNGMRINFDHVERSCGSKDISCELLKESQDPFAFDEDELAPSKWEVLSGKEKISRIKRNILKDKEFGNQLMMSQEASSGLENHQKELGDLDHLLSLENMSSPAADKGNSGLLSDCLLTAIKVLMNLTNENPVGCQQIAACGGLETMSSLIADHFPLFSSPSLPLIETKENTSRSELQHQSDQHLTDQELDYLVAILGLLVNLVEKDASNRSRLAAASIVLPASDGLEEESHRDVISLLCSIFLANRGAGDASEEGNTVSWDDEAALLQEEKEAEKMIVQAYAALLLAFLSTESKSVRDAIANFLPNRNLTVLVPVLERFVAFHLTLNMISPETHISVMEVIKSCRVP
ncbi:wings apart-like protein 1 isoform X1 [Tripterygium wilfordii]|uniref:wings apart-like protein 1 isoform X1 n=1 Tax=Tripterygium wilfordii TaxID=458696 RepID=UPI0018F82C73|nr:wings apart-like protein 1 isoform X1 [Tripterygium wilfordii]